MSEKYANVPLSMALNPNLLQGYHTMTDPVKHILLHQSPVCDDKNVFLFFIVQLGVGLLLYVMLNLSNVFCQLS